MAFNKSGLYDKDARYVFSGKDTCIFDEDGILLSTVESFQAQVSFTNAQYQALGSPIRQEFITGYDVTITMSQFIIEDDRFLTDIVDFFTVGRHAPIWSVQSVIYGYNKSQSRLIFRDCVPTGQIDLHTINVNDIIKRNLNFHVNQPPELQKLLKYAG